MRDLLRLPANNVDKLNVPGKALYLQTAGDRRPDVYFMEEQWFRAS